MDNSAAGAPGCDGRAFSCRSTTSWQRTAARIYPLARQGPPRPIGETIPDETASPDRPTHPDGPGSLDRRPRPDEPGRPAHRHVDALLDVPHRHPGSLNGGKPGQDAAAAGELDLAAAGAALVSAFFSLDLSLFVSLVELELSEPDSAFATALPEPERLSVR